jgi:hypothetical protein
MRTLVAVMVLCACSEKKPAPRQQSAEPPKPIGEPTPAPAPVGSGSAVAAGSGSAIGSGAGSADTGPGAAWTTAWKQAVEAPPGGAPRNKDWPCSAKSDGGLEYTWTYGGPAKCVTPPDESLVGCPIAVKKAGAMLLDDRKFFYDADGQLVAILSKPSKTEHRIRVTYDHGKAVSSETDDNGDGIPDSRTRFTYKGDKVVQETDFDGKGKYEQTDVLTLKDGKILSDVAKMATGRYVWTGNRLIREEATVGGKVQDTVKYTYDCK